MLAEPKDNRKRGRKVDFSPAGMRVVLGGTHAMKPLVQWLCEFDLGHYSKRADKMLENCQEKEVSVLYVYLLSR